MSIREDLIKAETEALAPPSEVTVTLNWDETMLVLKLLVVATETRDQRLDSAKEVFRKLIVATRAAIAAQPESQP